MDTGCMCSFSFVFFVVTVTVFIIIIIIIIRYLSLYTDTRYNDKIRYTDDLKSSLRGNN